ncbi:hypothetical protein NDU88_009067 [Pleurodeles waltl]|uniref:Uncharacterized protein n=1 Tax=Pleurodeles waltl TaxID=8319 RepID=A0AAV7QQM6_PLEWA|nr:hypothetical protein NDU88_009067 [Pleurodeles waltl]
MATWGRHQTPGARISGSRRSKKGRRTQRRRRGVLGYDGPPGENPRSRRTRFQHTEKMRLGSRSFPERGQDPRREEVFERGTGERG